jgi:hypothetical protein
LTPIARRKNQIGATERSKTVRDCESRKFVRFVTTNAATPTSIIPFTSVRNISRWLITAARSRFSGKFVMTPLFWYFPLIVFFGVCDAIIPVSEEQTVNRIAQAAHGTLEFLPSEEVL